MDKSLVANPFALMLHPADVVEAMERSDRLARLQRRVCKPLDKPVIPKAAEAGVGEDEGEDSLR